MAASKKVTKIEEAKISVRQEVWTPKQAEEALKQNKINRKLRDADVGRYRREMETGNWGTCTEPIVFDWNGNLIDGQHRLNAQVLSESSQKWLILRGVAPETQHHINTAVPRSAADQLRFAGKTNVQVLASVARWAFYLENDLLNETKFKISNNEILQMVEQHPDLEHSAYMAQYARNGFVEVMPTPVGAAHWWIAQHNNHAEADMFVDRIVQMNEPMGSPIRALVKRFSEIRKNRQHINTRDQIVMILRAWNYDVDRKYVSKLYTYNKSGEFKVPAIKQRDPNKTAETPLEGGPDDDE